MIKQYLVDMLVRKIKDREINPKTNEVFKLEDIKKEEYKTEVEAELNGVTSQ